MTTIIVWFHSVTEYDCKRIEQDTQYEQQLPDNFPQLQIFNDANECIDYITNCPSKSVFMILSDNRGIQVFSLVHQLESLKFVYILDTFSTDQYRKYNAFIKNCWIIRGVFKNLSKLIGQLQYEMISTDNNNHTFHLLFEQLNTIDDLDKQPNERLRFQLIFNGLLHSTDASSNPIRQMMLDECRCRYATDKRELNRIDEFDSTETKWSTIQWWTQDSFIYRLINSALRSRHWNSIIKYQYFIVKLYNEIDRLHHEQFISTTTNQTTLFYVYRGQLMLSQDLNILKNNIGGIVSMNYFLSTTLDQDIASIFSEGQRGITINVLFHILLDCRISSAVFADISQFSTMSYEKEILLSPGMVFRIQSVAYEDTIDKWIVHLNLIDPNEDSLLSFMSTDLKNSHFGQILYQMGEYETARDYCQFMLTNTDRPLSYHSILGNTFKELNDYDRALENHFSALRYVTSIYQCSTIYYNIGLAYLGKDDYTNAIRYYHEASELECVEGETMYLAEIYHDLGLAYISKGSLSVGLSYLERAFDIQKLILPENHYHLGITYFSLGNIYSNQNEIDRALDYYQHALDIFRCSRRTDDHLIINVHSSIVRLYLQTKQYDMARRTFENLAQIYGDRNNYLTLTRIYFDLITSVLFPQQEFFQCINFIEYILSINRKHLPENHRLIGVILYILGSFQLFLFRSNSENNSSDLIKLSCTNLEQSKEILKQYTNYLVFIYENLGLIYYSLKEYSRSIEYLNQSLKYSSKNNVRFSMQHKNLAIVYASTGDFRNAIKYLKISIDLYGHDTIDFEIISSHTLLGIYYKFIKSYNFALKHLAQALSLWRMTAGPLDADRRAACIYYHTADIYFKLNFQEHSYASQLFYFWHKQRLPPSKSTDPYFEYISGISLFVAIEFSEI